MKRGIIYFALVVTLAVSACATLPDARQERSQALVSQGRWEEAIALLDAAAKDSDPMHRYRAALIDARSQAALSLLRDADTLMQAGRYKEARAVYDRILLLDPAEQRASAGLANIDAAQRQATLLDEAERALRKNDLAAAEPSIRQVLIQAPRNSRAIALLRQLEDQKPRISTPALAASLRKPLTLEFRDANLRMVFDVMSRASGINFVLDKDIRADARASIFLKNAPIEDAIESLLATNQLAKKVLSENSILIYPNTPQKVRDYQDLVIRNFFLGSADAKQMMNLLRTILKTRDVYVDEKRNLLVIRDTPEAVQLAERLIKAQEQAEPEVVLELEVLEVSRTLSQNLGLQFPDSVGFGVASPTTLETLRNLNSAGVNVTGLATAATLNLKRVLGDTNLLANPRIRVRNREKAKVQVGQRVPIISTSFVASTTPVQTQQVNYLDVGLKLEVEPQVMDDDVVMKVSLEVSSLGDPVSLPGTNAYNVGTRNASTTLTLKDGETQVLAGLITDNDRQSARRFPGIGDFPLLGRLFSSNTAEKEKSEIILSITPHIVRRLERPDAALTEYWSGPETNLRSAVGVGGGPAGPVPGNAPSQPLGPGAIRPGGAIPGPSGAVITQPGAPAQPGIPTPVPGTGTTTPAPQPTGPASPFAPFIFQPPPGVGSQ